MAVILLTSVLCLLPLSVWGQATSIILLRESAEPGDTDHTGDIVSFTAVGSGAEGTSPRPWVCYTQPTHSDPTNVEWQTPDGVNILRNPSLTAPQNTVVTRSIGSDDNSIAGLVLSRGTNYFSPDGDYCCVLTIDGTESERRCVTFIPSTCPTLTDPSYPKRRIIYNPGTNSITYDCVTGYTAIVTSGDQQRTCQSDNTWTGSAPAVTCTIVTCPPLTDPNNGVVFSPDNNYLTTAMYLCPSGYVLTPSDGATRVCGADGEWSGLAPTCSPVNCGPLNEPANGMVDTSSGTTFMNTATYVCNPGYILHGDTTRTCQDNGEWSFNETTICEFIVLSTGNSFYNNNTQLELSDIGDGDSALSCHTELTTCCREEDNNGVALGTWVGPDRNSLPETREEGFYVTREMSSVSLNLVEGSTVTAGSYCCQVPRSNGGMSTHCIDISVTDIPVPPAESDNTSEIAIIVLGALLAASVVLNILFMITIIVMKTKKTHMIKQTRYEMSTRSPTNVRTDDQVTVYEDVREIEACPAYLPSTQSHI